MSRTPSHHPDYLFQGTGEMRTRCRDLDWSKTSLGPSATWPQSLRTAVQMVLASPFPTVILWGGNLTQIYNDGYRELMGDKHPAGLGQPTQHCWPEVWPINQPIYQRVWTGESFALTDALDPITRSGKLQDAWFTLAYSPVLDESGQVGGILVTVVETTDRLHREYQRQAHQAFLLKLSDTLRPMTDAQQIATTAMQGMGQMLQVLRAGYYQVEADQDTFSLTASWERTDATPLPSRMLFTEFGSEVRDGYRAGRTLVVRDTELEMTGEDNKAAHRAIGVRAWIGVPLIKHGRMVVGLGVHSQTPREWTSAEIYLVEQVAERTWVAIERARAEEALRQSEEKYRSLFETVDEGFSVIELVPDKTGRVVDLIYREANEVFERQSGLTNAIGKRASDFVSHLEPEWLDALTQVYQTGEPVRLEAQVAEMNRWYTTLYSRMGGAGSRFVSTVFNDITERKLREQHQEYSLRLSDALRRAGDAEAIQERAAALLGQQLGVSRALYFAVEREETGYVHNVRNDFFYDPNMPSLVGRHAQAAFGERVFDKLAKGETLVVPDLKKISFLTPDELGRFVALNIQSFVVVPLIRNGDYIAGFATAGFATRNWTAAEVALIEETAERTWAAVERASAEEAQQLADQRKDEFLAMLAHELRNPMATIRSGLQILRLVTGNDETSRHTIDMMNRQTDHLVRMVDDLLDVSRISQGKIALSPERVNLVEIVSQAADSVRALYQEQRKSLAIDLPATPIYLEGDATRLSQVVTNLLTNGARYGGEQGQVWLSLEHHRQEAILQVRDNGIGLPPDQLSAIFELFVQVDNSLARSKGGLGVGLTLVKRLVEMHGGRVKAQSQGIGKGSTFTVRLPTLAAAAKPITKPAPQAPATPTPRRVLVIDDNADAAMTLGMLLKLKGYESHTRTSGRSGLEAAERLQPAVILLDIGMPDLDGYATSRLLREQAWGQAMVIIALTGYGQEEDRQRTRDAGFDGHLVKPVDLDELTKLLTYLLEKGDTA